MLILLCVILLVLNFVIYPLCKVKYRSEDAEGIANGKIKVKSEVMYFPMACWIVSGSVLILALFFLNDMGIVVTMIAIQCIAAFFLCLVALFLRNSYYTIEEDRLTYVKHGNLEWSHSWDEIAHARKRVISTGKSFIILYDIETKDGVKHRSLPAVLGKELQQHVGLDNRINPVIICILLILAFVIGILISLGFIYSNH